MSSRRSVRLRPCGSIDYLVLCLGVGLYHFLRLTVRPRSVYLVFRRVAVLEGRLGDLVGGAFYFSPILSHVLRRRPTLGFRGSQVSQVFLRGITSSLLYFLRPIGLVIVHYFPRGLGVFLRFLRVETRVVPLLASLRRSVYL